MYYWMLVVLLFKIVTGQQKVFSMTTNEEQVTVTYTPDTSDIWQSCLPYDGSVVPDCSKYADSLLKEPYWVEHSSSKSNIYVEQVC